MRFRSRLSREGLSFLLSCCTSMASVHDTALLLIDPLYFRISVVSNNLENPRGYLELVAQELFDEYRVESAADNRIACEIPFALLLQALSSGKNATQAVLKLSKLTSHEFSHSFQQQRPCLSIVLDGHDQLLNVDVLHEIPLRLLKVSEVLPLVSQPDISPPKVALSLPSKKKLFKTLVERLSKLAKTVTLKGSITISSNNTSTGNNVIANFNMTGRLVLTAVSDTSTGVTVNTFLSQLTAHSLPNNNPSETVSDVEAEVRVSAKKLLCVLDNVNVPHSDVSLFFSPGEALVMLLQLQPACLGTLTFYLPVLVPLEFE